MAKKPLLSVVFVVQDQRDVIEPTLTALYEMSAIPFEIFIIDDASTDGSDEVIQSMLDYYQHEQTYYFSHQEATGRGYSLNEALMQCSGQLLWAPETISSIEEVVLSRSLERLADSENGFLLQQRTLPRSSKKWFQLLDQHNWIQDGDFIWNLASVAARQHFFNPYVEQHHGMELAARLNDASYLSSYDIWYQPSSFVEAPEPTFEVRQELLLTLLRKSEADEKQRDAILEKLQKLPAGEQRSYDNDILNEAIQMKRDGRFNAALELIESVLEDEPSHSGARNLKIEILEKKRRFVQASELKHEVSKSEQEPQQESQAEEEEQVPEQSQAKEQQQPTYDGENDPEISLIIPTTTYGKPALEHCLLSISEHCDDSQLELVVVDNASLDDTHDYLDELREKNFLNCQVITNSKNAGFATSINQGLEKARGTYACVIHNDVEFQNNALGKLKEIMDSHPDYAIVGPATNKTLNPEQATHSIDNDAPRLLRTEYLDSFCMMMRTDHDLRMDEDYELAFFEDIDLCFQARSKGHKIGIAPHVEVKHHFGTTTFSLDLDTESEQYWKNVSTFNEKWNIEVFSEEELKSLSTFDQLLALDDLVNPMFPEPKIQQQFEQIFTDELKTEILKSQHDPETLCKLVHLFMVMNEREVMRRLEDRLDNIKLPASLIFQLVRFYFNRNIFSRCKHYLNQFKPQNDSLHADLYRLAIHVESKDLKEAVPMLKNLMDRAPANPMLYKLAGDIHKFSGNEQEAASFYDLAEQINPFEFANEEKDAFGFKL